MSFNYQFATEDGEDLQAIVKFDYEPTEPDVNWHENATINSIQINGADLGKEFIQKLVEKAIEHVHNKAESDYWERHAI